MTNERRLAALGALHGQLQVAKKFAEPARVQEILELLTATAEVFQVSLPAERGLEIYASALSAAPRKLLIKAIRHVCETHRFKSMPLIADILLPIKDDMWAIGWLIETCELRIAELERYA